MNAEMLWGVAIFWVAGALAAYVYAQMRGIPMDITVSLLPAFLLEATLFLSLGSQRVRARLERLTPWIAGLLLTLLAAVPYVLASLASHTFDPRALGVIIALATVASFWFVVLPHGAPVDLLFLGYVGAVAFSRILQAQYVSPHERLPLGILGQLMWIRTAAFALLSVRRVQGVGFGFWPDGRHWRIGILHYVAFLPAAALVAWAVKFGVPHWPDASWARISVLAVGTFFGILWVTALGEEFLFRGLLQQWFGTWLHNEWAGLALTSILFGAVHLWTPRNRFPDWQFAPLVATAGVFYGLAFRQAKSIRASMVTHALTVTTWRVFFS
jgi:membrane protease YdiL (CAAX protease family)